MIVMQYAEHGNLLSYLDQNISMTWRMKLQHLEEIGHCLDGIHMNELVHGNLHDRNIMFKRKHHDNVKAFICDFCHSQSRVSNQKSNIQVVTPFIAPEVFDTWKHTQKLKSDIYAFGIIMYLVANGKIPFRNRLLDSNFARDIKNGLRPAMPASAPVAYKELAEHCCDADPNKRPEVWEILSRISKLIKEIDDDDIWDSILQ